MSSAKLLVPKGTATDLTTGLSLADGDSYMIQVIGAGALYLVEDDDVATVDECIDKGLRLRAGIGGERILDQEAGKVFTLLAVDYPATVIIIESAV